MTAAEQAYADQEDELRQMGFQAELGGDFALGQMFYHMAYGVTPPSSALDPAGGGGGLGSSSGGPNNGGAGSSLGATSRFGAGSSYVSDGSDFVDYESGGTTTFISFAVPEASTWAMMFIGFGGLAYAGWRRSRTPALPSA